MDLCVGAVSRRVVEVAAKFGRDRQQLLQIVASRRQVDGDKGYIGWTQRELVETVNRISKGRVRVVRDHGGPNKGWEPDDGIASFDADLEAGFDGLHLDVSGLPNYSQALTLIELFKRYHGKASLEVGGEHDPQTWNLYLMMSLPARPEWIVNNTGTYVWADRQKGHLRWIYDIKSETKMMHQMGIRVKAHNWDWLYRSEIKDEIEYVDAYNLAPELAAVEVDALLCVWSPMEVHTVLNHAYQSGHWKRWFHEHEGTFFERARCAVRYILQTPEVTRIRMTHGQEDFVRQRIQDAIIAG